MTMLLRALAGLLRVAAIVALIGLIALWITRTFLPPPSATLAGRFATTEQRDSIDRALTGSGTLLQEYGNVLRRYAALDFGLSFNNQQAVLPELIARLQLSLALTLPGALLAHLLALIAAVSARWRWLALLSLSAGALICSALIQIALSSPFALNLVPVLGLDRAILSLPWPRYFFVTLGPTLAIALSGFGVLYPIYRRFWLAAQQDASLQTIRALGLSSSRLRLQVFRLMRGQVLGWVLLTLPPLILGGSIVFESVFQAAGLGQWLQSAALTADAPILLAVTVVASAVVALSQWLADVLARTFDPRIQQAQ